MTYLPTFEADQITWMTNFAAKLTVHAATVSVTAAELASVQADAAFLAYLQRDLLPLYRAKAQEVTAYKELIRNGPLGAPAGTLPAVPAPPKVPAAVLPGVMARLGSLVQRIKNAPGYNQAIGADLGILPPGPRPLASDEIKPVFMATAMPGGQVRLDWIKGRLDGVRVESQRGAETDWTRLDDDRYSPYTDTRPPLQPGQAETRSYRLRYLKKDELVGSLSDVAIVRTLP